MRLLALAMLAALILNAQNPENSNFPANPDTDANLYVNNNRTPQKTLNGAITSGAGTIVLSSGSGWLAPILITVDSEIIGCSTLTAATLTGCTRGLEFTTPAAHSSGANVFNYLTAKYFNMARAAIKAEQAYLAARNGNSAAGGGTANAQTVTLAPPMPSLTNGALACWKPAASNITTTPTLAVSGLTAVVLTKAGGSGGQVALAASDILINVNACAIYNSTGPRWELQNPQTTTGGGGGGGNALSTVTFSATPTFTRTAANQVFVITLTGNVTSSTLSGASAGDYLEFNVIQDGTGSRTFAWPTGFSEACVITSTASIGTKQLFYWDGSAAHAMTPCVTTASSSNLMVTDNVNTGTAAVTMDLSPATTLNAFRAQVKAALTTTANGALGYDSTNNMLHAAQSSADAFVPQFTAIPANNDCVKWVVSGSNYKLGTQGAACGSGGGSAPQSVTFLICASTTCAVNDTSNWTNFITSAGTLSKCGILASVAPTGSAIIVDILKNGTSVFGANPKPTVATGSTAYASVTTFSAASVTEGDLLLAKVTQADSNSVGQFVAVRCAF